MTSGTSYTSSAGALTALTGSFVTLMACLFAVAGAALYALVLAFAANWAGHKKMEAIRGLILVWAWLHVAGATIAIASLSIVWLIHPDTMPDGMALYLMLSYPFATVIFAWVLVKQVKRAKRRLRR